MDVAATFPFRKVLNLDRRPDRFEAARANLAAAGLTADRFAAIDSSGHSARQFHRTGLRGHAATMRAALRDAERCAAPAALLIEDDAVFHPDFARRAAALQLPDDWGIFYFGCIHIQKPEPVSPGIVRVNRALDTHAVAIRAQHYRAAREAIAGRHVNRNHFGDVGLSYLHSSIPTYAAHPNLAWQGSADSDIDPERRCNYDAVGRQTYFEHITATFSGNMRRLLPLNAFDHVFGPWSGANARLFSDPLGNTGDLLLRAAEEQLFAHFGIRHDLVETPDVVFFGGGGNMGGTYASAHAAQRNARAEADRCKVPLVILPQSWIGPSELKGDVEFVRERASVQFAPGAKLAPDLALAYRPEIPPVPVEFAEIKHGDFFRNDGEQRAHGIASMGDPASMTSTPTGYIDLATRCRSVRTDRLHFAIASLIAGRDTTLYQNSYHKCRSMWETWLRDFGCSFADK